MTYKPLCAQPYTDNVYRFIRGELYNLPTIDNIPVNYFGVDPQDLRSHDLVLPVDHMHVPDDDDWVNEQIFQSNLDLKRRLPPIPANAWMVHESGASDVFF